MPFDPKIHHRRSIRLRGYDYSSQGAYFLTICTHERRLTLDDNNVREIVSSVWHDVPKRFPTIVLDEFVVMPNHVHGILFLAGVEHGPCLSDVIGAFKSISAIACNRARSRAGSPFWQRDYYERVIRDERELNAAREYVWDNPRKWDEDVNNPANPSVRPSVSRKRGVVGVGQAHAPTPDDRRRSNT